MMTDEEITITRAGVEDAAELTALSRSTFLEAFAADNRKEDMDKYLALEMNVTKIASELADQRNIFLLAWLNGTLAGYAKLGTAMKPEAKNFSRPIELERIYVLKNFYGKKIGATLMNLCLTYAANHHYDTMWLGVWQLNHRAVNFYKQWGFTFYGTHQFALGDDIQTDELMKKVL